MFKPSTDTRENKYKQHPVVLVIIRGVVLLVFIIIIVLIVATFYRAPLERRAENYFIYEYSQYNDVQGLSRQEILDQIPQDEKDILLYIELLRIPVLEFAVIVLMIGNGFLLLKYNLKSNSDGVWMDKEQYPKVYSLVKRLSKKAGLKHTPKVFLLTGEGADSQKIACAISARNHLAIPIDILDLCVENNDYESLSFIIGHEIGHHVLGHRSVFHNMVAAAIFVFPPLKYTLGNPMFRAKEYSADKVASLLSKDEKGKSLLVLVNSSVFHKSLNFNTYVKEHLNKGDFGTVLSNLLKEHPPLSWRVKAIRQNKNGRIF